MLADIINQHFNSLNENDLHILGFISNNINLCLKSTLVEIASLCNVSPSTISRTTQKLGFEGFSQFKYYLVENSHQVKLEKATIEGSFKSSILMNDFTETLRFFEINGNLNNIYEIMKNSGRIFAYGTGHAQNLMLQEFGRCMLNNGIFINILSSKTELNLIVNDIKPTDMVFFVALSGNVELINPILNTLSLKKIPMVSVTLFSQNKLAALCDYNLYYHLTNFNAKNNLNNSSFFTLHLVLALLYEGFSNYLNNSEDSSIA